MARNIQDINELLELARYHVMNEKEKREQRISFAWGNAAVEHPEITRELVESAADKYSIN
jgi:hypothetical protein